MWARRVTTWLLGPTPPDPQLTEIAGLLRELVQATTRLPARTQGSSLVARREYTAADVYQHTRADDVASDAQSSIRKTSPWRFEDPGKTSPL